MALPPAEPPGRAGQTVKGRDMKAIAAKSLKMVYRSGVLLKRKVALDSLDLAVEEGEIFGYLGPNGAGKSTTIKILTGIARATAGTAEILGAPAGSLEARRNTGLLPEEPHFYEYLRAAQALFLYARLSGLRRREARSRCDEVLEQVGLAGSRRRRLGDFSRGMRQRFGLAQAIVHRPRVLLLDEPMSGLDSPERRDIQELTLRLRDAGTTVFLSSHALHDVEKICDRVGIVHRGRLQAVGKLSDVLPRRVKCVDLSADGVSPEGLRKLEDFATTLSKDGASTWARVREDEVGKAIDIIRGAGGQIREVAPRRMTLEKAFLQMSRKAGPAEEEERDDADDSGV